jgi:anti-sigma B factor antagonist
MPDSGSELSSARISIDGELNIYRAHEIKQTFLAAVRDASALEVDLSSVTEIDSAGVQLLMMLRSAARERACEVRLTGPSPAVCEVFELLELTDWCDGPVPAESSPA